MEKLLEGLRHFRENLLWQRRDLFEESARGQHPLAMLICCSDSRVLPESLMQADPGDLFISRNAGNFVPPGNMPGGEAAAIEYAVKVLGVSDIVVCGHYRCGAVKAILEPESCAQLPMMTNWLTNAVATRELINRELKGEFDEIKRWDRAVELNVLVQAKSLLTHAAVAEAVAAGTLRIHAWVLRFETSEILAHDEENKEFVPLLELPIIRKESLSKKKKSLARQLLSRNSVEKPPTWHEILTQDLPASLAVFLVALPLCIAIARASGAPPEAGLVSGIVGGILVGFLGGSPLQISGPAAGMIAILLHVIHEEGLAHMGAVVVLAGILQLVGAKFRLGQWFRAISPAVFLGILAGIGAVLVAQQFHVMVDHTPDRVPFQSLLKIPESIYLGFTNDQGTNPGHRPAAIIGLLTLVVLAVWKRMVPATLKRIPSVIVAVLLTTLITAVWKLPIQRVEFSHLTAGFDWLEFSDLPTYIWHREVWLGAIVIAILASTETLLCASGLEQRMPTVRRKYDRELAAQGLGNALCGMIGGLPMAGAIVRTSANVEAGARSRWSAVFHGIWLLLFAVFFPGLIRLIPTASLAAILVMIGIRLVNLKAIRRLWNESRDEVGICVATATAVLVVNLFAGMIVGIALSGAKLLYSVSRLRILKRNDVAHDRITLVLEGSATFLRLPKLAAALEDIPPDATLHIDFKGLEYIDHACLTLLMNWEKQHESTGGELVLDWDTLRARFHRNGRRSTKRDRKTVSPVSLEASAVVDT
jgi:MFS superfamily sulfate permease-like transporter/carbonic anhydrase